MSGDLFTRIWKDHEAELFRRCLYWMKGNRADAQEAFSQAIMTIYRKLPEHYGKLTNLRAWLFRLTYNTCMDLHREKRRQEKGVELDLDSGLIAAEANEGLFSTASSGDPERAILGKELETFLRRCIDDLPERLRETVLCHLSFGNHRETAQCLAISEENVRKRLQEARAILGLHLRTYRSGRARMPASPRKEEQEAGLPRDSRRDGPWRIHAIRSVRIRLGAGMESETVLFIGYPLKRASKRRREALETYIRTHPTGWTRRLELGRHLMEEGLLEEAIPQLERVVLQQPDRFQVWIELAMAHRLLERPEAAAAVCDRALAVVRTKAEHHYLGGLRDQCRGRIREAVRAFEEACEARPDRSAPRIALAELRLSTGSPSEALFHLDEALKVDPEDAAALTLGYAALRLSGRSAEALRRSARALEIDSANVPALVHWLVGRCRALGGQLPHGGLERRRLQRLRELARTQADARRGLAFWYACRGDLAGARRLLTGLVDDRPALRQGWMELARLLDAMGRSAEALQALSEARKRGDQGRELDLMECRMATRAGFTERALWKVDELLRRYGEAWDIASAAAWSLMSLGYEAEWAGELSRSAVALQPLLPAAWLEHGRVLACWGRLREAAEAFATAWKLLPEGDGADLAAPVAHGLAEVHRRLGDVKASRRWSRMTLAVAAALGAGDPAQACLWHRRAWADLGGQAAQGFPHCGSAAGAEVAPGFLELEEQWTRVAQFSEPPLG